MSRDDHLEEHCDEESFVMEVPRLHPHIFEGNWQEAMPAGFDAVTIHLDGGVKSDLDWKNARLQAQQAIDQGYALMWNMQMGLFADLVQPLTHQAQFLSLTLALEHFRDSFWKEFKSQTIGLTLFRGSVDFSEGFRWDDHQKQNLKHWLQEIETPLESLDFSQLMQEEEGKQLIRLYCRDVAIEYLSLLATRVPDSLPTYLFLDVSSFSGSRLHEMQILNPERFDRLHLALKGHQLPFDVIGWEEPTAQGYSGTGLVNLLEMQIPSIGVCIPPMHFHQSHHYQGMEEGVAILQEKGLPFKLIAENFLTSQWDGLDYLLYSPAGLTVQGKRKLQGFCAAGGTVVSTDNLLGLPYELSLQDWLKVL